MALIKLPLQVDNRHLYLNPDLYQKQIEDLDFLLDGQRHLKTKSFAKDVMFSHELLANNHIEGYSDDIFSLNDIMKNHSSNYSKEKILRIRNLYRGYNYILNNNDINEDSINALNQILSKGLIEESLQTKMNGYYRSNDVYILQKGRLDDSYDKGIDPSLISSFIHIYLDFLNNYSLGNKMTDEYIKSQIMHFYFVYIHPYYDVNGRTSRSIAMWYLLNQKVYPYIIFNRGISFKGSVYDELIKKTKETKVLNYFINFMLDTVEEELEKEYIMQNINQNTTDKLSAEDWQTILYILSQKRSITLLDLVSFYNRFNNKKKPMDVYEEFIVPLINKKIILLGRKTSKQIKKGFHNMYIYLNPEIMDYNRNKIKKLILYK